MGVFLSLVSNTYSYSIHAADIIDGSLISKLAKTFNLKEEDIKAVLTSVYDERLEQMKRAKKKDWMKQLKMV